MFRLHPESRLLPAIVLAVALLAAQTLVVAHDLDHDAANAQNPVCATCVAASQLGSACVDHHAEFEVAILNAPIEQAGVCDFTSLHSVATRQRGPPSPP